MKNRIRRKKLEREAEGYLELGMAEHALNTLDRVGNASAFSANSYYLQGEAFRQLERYREALAPLRQAVELNPFGVPAYVALGWCHKRLDRLDLAIEAMGQALSADSSEAIFHYNLSCYLSLAGQKLRALNHLARALSIDPGYRALIDDEPDFDSLRNDPDFLSLTEMIA